MIASFRLAALLASLALPVLAAAPGCTSQAHAGSESTMIVATQQGPAASAAMTTPNHACNVNYRACAEACSQPRTCELLCDRLLDVRAGSPKATPAYVRCVAAFKACTTASENETVEQGRCTSRCEGALRACKAQS